MKQQYKHNMITRSQRAIAYLLLVCQLLTSCGGKNTLLPRDPNSQLTTTVNEQQTICLDNNHPQLDTQPTNLIDGTPLKLGQPEIQFTWDKEQRLQAFTVDPSMGSMAIYVPIRIPTAVTPGNGDKKIVLSQLNRKQAEAVVKNFKWEVTKEGKLKERSMRLRGGMQDQPWRPNLRTASSGTAAGTPDEQSANTPSQSSDSRNGRSGGKSPEQEPDKASSQTKRVWRVGKQSLEQQSKDQAQVSPLSDSRTGRVVGQSCGLQHDSISPNVQQPTSKPTSVSQTAEQSPVKQPASTNTDLQQPKQFGPRQRKNSETSHGSQCSACSHTSDPGKYHKYHLEASKVIKKFFEDHFKTSEYIDLDKGIVTEQHPHYGIASTHNSKLAFIKDSSKGSHSLKKPQRNQSQFHGLNMVIASIQFKDTEDQEILTIKLYQKEYNAINKTNTVCEFIALDYDKYVLQTKDEKQTYRSNLVKQFDESIASLLRKNPNLLKQHSVKFRNPLLTEDGKSYADRQQVYNLIYSKIKDNLNPPAEGEIEASDSNLEYIIFQSIISSRRHSEEALANYMRSKDFKTQLKDALNEEIKRRVAMEEQQNYENYENLEDIIKFLRIQRINIDVHSTKESCLPCQVTLRTVQHSLAEMFFVGNKADLLGVAAAMQEEEDARKQVEVGLIVSSQITYPQGEKKYDDIPRIQYAGNNDLSKLKVAEKTKEPVTAFLDGVFETVEGLAARCNTSSHLAKLEEELEVTQVQLEETQEQLQQTQAERDKALEEAKKAKAELEELKARFAALNANTASSSAGATKIDKG
jgi:hypothetical protein